MVALRSAAAACRLASLAPFAVFLHRRPVLNLLNAI